MNKQAVLSALFLVPGAPATASPPFETPRQIFLLSTGQDVHVPLEVAYHSGFRRFYAAFDDGPTSQVWTFDTTGSIVSGPTDAGIVIRALEYNDNTGQIEIVQAGDAELRIATLDGVGNFVDASASAGVTIEKPHPDSMPAYDPAQDEFLAYGASGSDSISVISRSTGLTIETIVLDLGSAGVPATNLSSFACAYLNNRQWIVVFDAVNDAGVVFDRSGSFCGPTFFDHDVPAAFGLGGVDGLALDWVVAFDDVQQGWQVYRLSPASCPDPNECGDWDGDGDSDGDDFFDYLDAFDRRDPCADLDGCGSVDGDDFFAFLDAFVERCP